jgi:hypothetical protein
MDAGGMPVSRSLLATALVAAQLPEDVPEARMVRGWLDTWHGTNDAGIKAELARVHKVLEVQLEPTGAGVGSASPRGPSCRRRPS